MGKFISISDNRGPVPAWLSLPSNPNGRGLVAAMPIWGLNADLRKWADFMADLGYAVIAPNLFWRWASDLAVEYDFSRIEEVADVMGRNTDEQGVEDLYRGGEELGRLARVDGIGVVGWCYGGRLACLTGIDGRFDSIVAYYPTILETRLDIAGRLKAPLCLHLPEIEEYATRSDAIERIAEAFAGQPDVKIFDYPAVKHGFAFSPPHPNFDAPAARLADVRTALFLQETMACSQ